MRFWTVCNLHHVVAMSLVTDLGRALRIDEEIGTVIFFNYEMSPSGMLCTETWCATLKSQRNESLFRQIQEQQEQS